MKPLSALYGESGNERGCRSTHDIQIRIIICDHTTCSHRFFKRCVFSKPVSLPSCNIDTKLYMSWKYSMKLRIGIGIINVTVMCAVGSV